MDTKLKIFVRKVIRKLYGDVFEEGERTIRSNSEIERIFEKKNIVRFINAGRIRWLDHVQGMGVEMMLKRIPFR